MFVELFLEFFLDIDDDLADSDPDDAEDALRPQPLPPGVEVEDEVNVGVNPRQESIWELLEQPIEKQQQPETSQKPIEPTIEPNGNINILISSIRANVEKKTAQIPVPIPVVPSTNVPSIGITSKDANNALQALETIETNMAVDSPCNYEHAFQSLDSTDSYPDIATDLALTGHEDLSSTALNDDVMDVDPLHAESATPAVQSEEEKEAEVFGKVRDYLLPCFIKAPLTLIRRLRQSCHFFCVVFQAGDRMSGYVVSSEKIFGY